MRLHCVLVLADANEQACCIGRTHELSFQHVPLAVRQRSAQNRTETAIRFRLSSLLNCLESLRQARGDSYDVRQQGLQRSERTGDAGERSHCGVDGKLRLSMLRRSCSLGLIGQQNGLLAVVQYPAMDRLQAQEARNTKNQSGRTTESFHSKTCLSCCHFCSTRQKIQIARRATEIGGPKVGW